MYLVLIAWLYVTFMMALAEALSPTGSILGAAVTFTFYGLLPMTIVGYILGTPERKRRLRRQREAEQRAWDAAHPHISTTTPPVTPAATSAPHTAPPAEPAPTAAPASVASTSHPRPHPGPHPAPSPVATPATKTNTPIP